MSAVITDPMWFEIARAIRAEAMRHGASILTTQRAMRLGLRELNQGRTPGVCVAEATRLLRATYYYYQPETA